MCAIFGLIDYERVLSPKHRTKILKVLSSECEVRGIDATGFAYNSKNGLRVYKRPRPAHKMQLFLPPEANVIIGHTRMATQGDQRINRNNHPFVGNADRLFALAHNGIIYNDNVLQSQHNFPDRHIETDSYVAVQLIEEKEQLDFDSLTYMAEQLRGSFMFTLLDEKNNVYLVKGDNPITVYRYEGFYVYASTKDILDGALKKLGLDTYKHEAVVMCGGDIFKIDRNGAIEKGSFDYYDNEYDCFGMLRSWSSRKIKPQKDEQKTRYSQIIEYANSNGFSENEVDLLIEYGYDFDEVEELLYDPIMFHETLCEIYGLYEEDMMC